MAELFNLGTDRQTDRPTDRQTDIWIYRAPMELKMKWPDKNDKGKNGHMSCSEGYNFNIYKDKINFKVNSQSREQMHAKLDKCCLSLKTKTYHDFFSWMTAYFAINNLRNMNLL